MSFQWALDYPELYILCHRFNLTEIASVIRVSYRPFKGILQEGPQCGLVALALIKNDPSQELVRGLLLTAQNAGFTYNGEMFSARDMVELAKLNLNTKVTLYEGLLKDDKIKEFLFSGGLMLVPYDVDRDHSPCQLKGHKAHWALITGIIETNTETYVTAKHGKSLNTAFWKLSRLSESNAQLEEICPLRKLEDMVYKLPEGGIGGDNGLKCKAICIWPSKDSCSFIF